MGKNNQPFVENGKYIWDEANSEISINIEGEAPVKYKLENNTLTQLNADGQKHRRVSLYVCFDQRELKSHSIMHPNNCKHEQYARAFCNNHS